MKFIFYCFGDFAGTIKCCLLPCWLPILPDSGGNKIGAIIAFIIVIGVINWSLPIVGRSGGAWERRQNFEIYFRFISGSLKDVSSWNGNVRISETKFEKNCTHGRIFFSFANMKKAKYMQRSETISRLSSRTHKNHFHIQFFFSPPRWSRWGVCHFPNCSNFHLKSAPL